MYAYECMNACMHMNACMYGMHMHVYANMCIPLRRTKNTKLSLCSAAQERYATSICEIKYIYIYISKELKQELT